MCELNHTVFCIWPSELSLFSLMNTTQPQSVTVSIETTNTKNYLNSSLSFEKTALTFCLPLLSHCFIVLDIINSYKMICLDSPHPPPPPFFGPVRLGQVTPPARYSVIYLAQTTRRVIRALFWTTLAITKKKLNYSAMSKTVPQHRTCLN